MAGSIAKLVEFMRAACEDWDLGYDQGNRWDVRDGGECDCSSLVITALKRSGFDVGSASYTGDLSASLTKRGWARIKFTSLDQCRVGDILLNDACHVAVVISGSGRTALLAQASIDERGRVSGGQAGDQTGRETNVRQVYVYSRGWDCILRYSGGSSGSPGESAPEQGATDKLDEDGVLGPLTVSEWQRQRRTVVDGVVSGQGESCAAFFPALASVTFEGTGSALMRSVQEAVGVPHPTGVIARGTVCLVQGWLVLRGYDIGHDEAGVLGTGTAKAIQRSLNEEAWA